jgi:hypothetical protein
LLSGITTYLSFINNAEISSGKCPYCGIDGANAFNIDHFLPRSQYPEFSVYSENLVAVCAECNSRYKNSKFIIAGKRQFFNPYFDTFIDKRFLLCKISVSNTGFCKFEFEIDKTLLSQDPYAYEVLSNHFKQLKLGSRFTDLVLKKFFLQFKRQYFTDTRQPMDVTRDKLIEDIDLRLRGLNGVEINHHEKIFWESLKNCNELLDLIVDKKLPFD